MEVPARRDGLNSTLSPDELYVNYINTVAGLPNDVTAWLITICSS